MVPPATSDSRTDRVFLALRPSPATISCRALACLTAGRGASRSLRFRSILMLATTFLRPVIRPVLRVGVAAGGESTPSTGALEGAPNSAQVRPTLLTWVGHLMLASPATVKRNRCV